MKLSTTRAQGVNVCVRAREEKVLRRTNALFSHHLKAKYGLLIWPVIKNITVISWLYPSRLQINSWWKQAMPHTHAHTNTRVALLKNSAEGAVSENSVKTCRVWEWCETKRSNQPWYFQQNSVNVLWKRGIYIFLFYLLHHPTPWKALSKNCAKGFVAFQHVTSKAISWNGKWRLNGKALMLCGRQSIIHHAKQFTASHWRNC